MTRYGNVMASRGSVIPLFVRQIKAGQPITITDPDMTRFMMSLDDAVDLVLYALRSTAAGRHLRPEGAGVHGRPIWSQALKNMFRTPRIRVQVIGTRHGEKIYETLVSREEIRRSEDLGRYYRVPMDDRDLNYNKYFTEGDAREAATDDYTSHNTRRLTMKEVESLLLRLPEVTGELASWRKQRRRRAR